MNEGRYLIPANSKKSGLLLGLFTYFDAALFGGGLLLTILLLVAIHTESVVLLFIMLMPAIITGFLVFPIPNYHNVLQLIINIYTFYFMRQRVYKWKGWCYKNERDNK